MQCGLLLNNELMSDDSVTKLISVRLDNRYSTVLPCRLITMQSVTCNISRSSRCRIGILCDHFVNRSCDSRVMSHVKLTSIVRLIVCFVTDWSLAPGDFVDCQRMPPDMFCEVLVHIFPRIEKRSYSKPRELKIWS